MEVPVSGSPLEGRPPVPEVVVPDLDSMVRWHEHDYPHPLARWHTHPEVEVHLIRASTGIAFVGDYAGRFEPGHLVLVGSQVPHNWISDLAPGEVVHARDAVLQVHPDRVRELAKVAPEAQEAVALLRSAARGVEYSGATADEAARALERVGRATGVERLQHLFSLFALLSRAPEQDRHMLARRAAAAAPDLRAQQRIDAVLRYIADRLEGEISLEEAAGIVGMTPPALSRFFTRTAGRGFAETVRRLRIIRACALLADTDRAVADICFAVGYQNLSNFNRQFRKETGMTPRQYRRSHG